MGGILAWSHASRRGIIPGIPGDPNDERIDLDALAPPLSLVIMIANLASIKALKGETWYSRLYRDIKAGLRRFIGLEEPVEKASKLEVEKQGAAV